VKQLTDTLAALLPLRTAKPAVSSAPSTYPYYPGGYAAYNITAADVAVATVDCARQLICKLLALEKPKDEAVVEEDEVIE
jgi:hypothetical protein